LLAGGFPAQAVSRGYYAVFHAAESALLALEETRSKHSGVVAAFGQLVVRGGGFDEETAKTLRSLFERRNAADYLDVPLAPEDAANALNEAGRFIDAVDTWVAARRART
jgi:hypothetical protein